MSNFLEASVEMINDKMMFRGISGDNPAVITDYIPPYGDGKGYMPLQLFLISFASCLGGSISVLVKKMGRHMNGLSIDVKGTRREQHPTSFESIAFDVRLVSVDMTDEEMQKALKASEEKLCPVWAMIKGNVAVETSFSITRG